MRNKNNNKNNTVLLLFCVINFLTQLISFTMLIMYCRDSVEYGPLLMQTNNRTIFSETSPDGKYTVKLCKNVLVCSNNDHDTQFVDTYCILNSDISGLNVNEKNIDVEWQKNEMKIRIDYSYTNNFNLFRDNKFSVTVPYSDFT